MKIMSIGCCNPQQKSYSNKVSFGDKTKGMGHLVRNLRDLSIETFSTGETSPIKMTEGDRRAAIKMFDGIYDACNGSKPPAREKGFPG